MPQTLLNFKLESTNEKLTPRVGVAIFGEYLKGMRLESLCNSNIPIAKRANGYTPFEFIYPLILMLHSGGRVLDDIKEIRLDTALSTLLKMKKEANFKVSSPFQPAGNQPTAIKELSDSILKGNRYQTLEGVTGSGKTYTMARVIENVKMPTIIMTHNKTLAAQLYSEFRVF